MALKYKLVAVDIDGTLLNGAGEITPRAAKAARNVVGAGAAVVLATGRRYRSALPYSRQLGLETYLICQHGSVIKRLSDDKTVISRPLDTGLAMRIGKAVMAGGLEPMFFLDAYETGIDVVFATEPKRAGTVEYASLNPGIWRVGMEAAKDQPVVEVAVFDDRSELEAMRIEHERHEKGLTKSHIMKVTHYSFAGLEIISQSAGKGNGLIALAKLMGIEPEETAAIGDGVNDIEMVEMAGLGVAMGNGSEAIKGAAGMVVATNEQEGAAEALERILEYRA